MAVIQFQPPQPIQQEPSLQDRMMRAFMMGRQERQQRERMEAEREERDLRRDYHRSQLQQMKTDEKRRAFEDRIKAIQALEGTPGPQAMIPGSPGSAGGPIMEIGGAPSAPPQLGVNQQAVEMPHPQFDVEVPGAGINIPMRPRNAMEAFQQKEQERRAALQAKILETAGVEPAKQEAAEPYEKKKFEREKGWQAEENRLNRENTTRNARIQAAATAAAAKAGVEGKLRDDFRADFKTFNNMDDAIAKVRSSAQDPTGAGDLTMVYNIVKIMDPDSVVREGEISLTKNLGSLGQRLKLAYKAAAEGRGLDDTVKSELLTAAEKQYQAIQPRRKKVLDYYRSKGLDADALAATVSAAGGAEPGAASVPNPYR